MYLARAELAHRTASNPEVACGQQEGDAGVQPSHADDRVVPRPVRCPARDLRRSRSIGELRVAGTFACAPLSCVQLAHALQPLLLDITVPCETAHLHGRRATERPRRSDLSAR